jgi:hypothetical protein
MFRQRFIDMLHHLYNRLTLVKVYRSTDDVGSVQCSGVCPSGRRCTRRIKTDVTPAFCSEKHANGAPRTVFFEGLEEEAELLSNIRQLGWETFAWYMQDTRTRLAMAQMERVCISTPASVVEVLDEEKAPSDKIVVYREEDLFRDL